MDTKQKDVIEACRNGITALDQEIFRLIKQREVLSAQIGEAKRGLNIPDRDIAREKAVFDHALKLATTLDLPQSLATALQQLIIEVSLSRQERDRIKQSALHQALSVLVIGGSGRMGGWLSRFFADSGHNISVVDQVKPDFEANYYQHLDERVLEQDLVVIATPIRVSASILNKLKDYSLKKPVIFDVSSVKTPVFASLAELRDQGVKVTSLHPMFGPSVQLLFGKHLIITSLGVREADDLARSLFKSTALTVVDMSIDEHDRTMSKLLSLSHMINILFVTALKHSHVPIESLERLASPTFSNCLSMARKVFDENPHLYYEIQALNPHNKNTYEELRCAFNHLLEVVTNLKEPEFVAIMQAGQNYLGRAL